MLTCQHCGNVQLVQSTESTFTSLLTMQAGWISLSSYTIYTNQKRITSNRYKFEMTVTKDESS